MLTAPRHLGLLGSTFLSAALLACGGGGSDVDSGPSGPCSGTYHMAWPDDDSAELCLLPWNTSKDDLVLTECGEVFESCSDSGATPNFTCLDDPPGAPPSTPATVTLTGFVDVFSSGPDADQARIQVFTPDQLDGVDDFDTVTPTASFDIVLDETSLAAARACPKEKDFKQGQCVMPTDDCGGQCDKDLGAGAFCYQTECVDLQRWEIRYTIENIPTNQFLVIRTVGLDGSGNPQITGNTWAPLIQYNVYFATNDRTCDDENDRDCIETSGDPIYRANINLLSSQDYDTIPTSAGLSAGITPGHGAIAGEVHDCDGSRIQHAQIGFTVGEAPRVLVYFNGNVVQTLPRLQQSTLGTNQLSLFALLDMTPGEVEIGGIGVSNGALREAGRFTARVWPDSVSLVRLGGGRPAQE